VATLDLDERTQAALAAHRFDAATFERLRARLATAGPGAWSNSIAGTIELPAPGEVAPLPEPRSAALAAAETRGRAALAAGEVGVILLAGGMATRFGGVVKAAAEVFPGRTFMDLKLADVAARAADLGTSIPVYVMTSFATHAEVTRLAALASTARVAASTFVQSVALRLTPEGELFREAGGAPSLYAPGHGDLTSALRDAGLLARFRAAGGRVLFMSNVDNVAASLDPVVIGAHLQGGAAITVEVVDKQAGDRGGAPARVDGRLQIVEAFRFPKSFDQDAIPVFNTNTLLFDAAAIDRDFDLTWFAVQKTIEGRSAVQFERLVGELTAFLPSRFLRVPRLGPESRFLPIKDPEELALRQPEIERRLARLGLA
jgi:UTP--glucose-1-phosphate uridylyltransferase